MKLSFKKFIRTMRDYAKLRIEINGSVTSDDLRAYAESMKYEAPHSNAWGAVFRHKSFAVVGRQPSRVEKNHRREIKVWALAS